MLVAAALHSNTCVQCLQRFFPVVLQVLPQLQVHSLAIDMLACVPHRFHLHEVDASLSATLACKLREEGMLLQRWAQKRECAKLGVVVSDSMCGANASLCLHVRGCSACMRTRPQICINETDVHR